MNKTIVIVALLAIGCSASAQLGGVLSKVKKSISTNASSGSQTGTSSQDESTASSSSSQSVTKLDDMGITNATHKKYVGQIVWSSEKISFETPDETKFKTKFNAGEYIYGRYYLPESFQNFILRHENMEIQAGRIYSDVYVDGVLQNFEFDPSALMSEQFTGTTRQIFVHLPIKADTNYGDTKRWVEIANAMSPGEHTVKFDLRIADHPGVVVSSNFTYVKGTEKLKCGWNFGSYASGMKDATLEAGILKCIQNAASAQGWDEKFSKLKIYSNDWNTLRNEYGVILGRTVGAYCYATWPDGHCTVQPFVFKQDYNGSDYSKALILFSNGSQDVVDCD